MPGAPHSFLGREGHPPPRGYFRNPWSDVLVELESDDLPRYRMIEEPAGLSAFPGDKIEDR